MGDCNNEECKVWMYDVKNVKVDQIFPVVDDNNSPNCPILRRADEPTVEKAAETEKKSQKDPVDGHECSDGCTCVNLEDPDFTGKKYNPDTWSMTYTLMRTDANGDPVTCSYSVTGSYDVAAVKVDGKCNDGKGDKLGIVVGMSTEKYEIMKKSLLTSCEDEKEESIEHTV